MEKGLGPATPPVTRGTSEETAGMARLAGQVKQKRCPKSGCRLLLALGTVVVPGRKTGYQSESDFGQAF